MVQEVCAMGYGTGWAREGSKGSAERLVGRSASRAAVGVVEEKAEAYC